MQREQQGQDIHSSIPALGSSGRISGRASASFAVSVLSHLLRYGVCSWIVDVAAFAVNCAPSLVGWRSRVVKNAGEVPIELIKKTKG